MSMCMIYFLSCKFNLLWPKSYLSSYLLISRCLIALPWKTAFLLHFMAANFRLYDTRSFIYLILIITQPTQTKLVITHVYLLVVIQF